MPAFLATAIAAGAGTGLEFLGNMQSANQGVSRRTVRRRGRAAIDQARASEGLFAGLEESALKAGHKKEMAGFGGARAALDLGATRARQGVQTRGRQAQGQLEQSIVSKGLLGTTGGVGRVASLQDQTTRQLADIDLQLAQALASLGLEEGALGGQQGRELAGMAAKRRARDVQFQDANFGALTMA